MSVRKKFEYIIQYTKAADKFFNVHEDVREKYEAAIRELLVGTHPESVDVKRIRGRMNDYFRIRLGKWRVIYAVINGTIVVINTISAGSRGDVYKQSGLK